MREQEYRKESIICFVTCLSGLGAFIGMIYVTSVITGQNLASTFPDIPWSDLMNWEKIAENLNIKSP